MSSMERFPGIENLNPDTIEFEAVPSLEREAEKPVTAEELEAIRTPEEAQGYIYDLKKRVEAILAMTDNEGKKNALEGMREKYLQPLRAKTALHIGNKGGVRDSIDALVENINIEIGKINNHH